MDGRGTAVVSICVVSDWVNFASTGSARPLAADHFVTGIFTDQYCGDPVPLSPMVTMPRTRVHGAVVYGLNRIIDNTNLPGTVQAPLINSATLTPLSGATSGAVVPENMPTFLGMSTFRW